MSSERGQYVEELAKEAEEAAEYRNMKELYNITRMLSGKRNAPEKQVGDKNSNIQTTVEEQKKDGKNFSSLWNYRQRKRLAGHLKR